VLAIVSAVIAWLLFRARKSKQQKDSTAHEGMLQEEKQQGHVYAHELYSPHGAVELSQREHAELAAHNAPQELEANSGKVH
jgi:hypothetical protein